jgi:hypothetical protein
MSQPGALMSTQGPIDPLQEILSKSNRLLAELGHLHQQLAGIRGSALAELKEGIAQLKPEIAGVKSVVVQLETGQQGLLDRSRQVLTDISSLPQRPHNLDPSSLADLKSAIGGMGSAITDVSRDLAQVDRRQHGDVDRISDLIRQQAESKTWKIALVAIPVLLTVGLGFFVDASGKRLATRLALTQEFYKRKLSVYEEADKQMAAVIGCLEDLRLNPDDSAQTTAAFDNVRKLSDVSKTNGLYMTKEVSEGLNDVSFTVADSPPLNGKPGSNLKTITDKADKVEAQMKKELEGFGSLD